MADKTCYCVPCCFIFRSKSTAPLCPKCKEPGSIVKKNDKMTKTSEPRTLTFVAQ